MPRLAPPEDCPGLFVDELVPAGTVLWRVHADRYAAEAFNPTPRRPGASPFVEGGRFDSIDGSYAYLYGARSLGGAFAETFARNLDYTRPGPRPLRFNLVAGKVSSSIEVQRDLHLVQVYGAGAEQLGQDGWLTACTEDDYPLTRQWAAAVRRWAPSSDGLAWKSRRDPSQDVMMLWGAPAGAAIGCGVVKKDGEAPLVLGSGPGLLVLQQWLVKWRLYIEPGP